MPAGSEGLLYTAGLRAARARRESTDWNAGISNFTRSVNAERERYARDQRALADQELREAYLELARRRQMEAERQSNVLGGERREERAFQRERLGSKEERADAILRAQYGVENERYPGIAGVVAGQRAAEERRAGVDEARDAARFDAWLKGQAGADEKVQLGLEGLRTRNKRDALEYRRLVEKPQRTPEEQTRLNALARLEAEGSFAAHDRAQGGPTQREIARIRTKMAAFDEEYRGFKRRFPRADTETILGFMDLNVAGSGESRADRWAQRLFLQAIENMGTETYPFGQMGATEGPPPDAAAMGRQAGEAYRDFQGGMGLQENRPRDTLDDPIQPPQPIPQPVIRGAAPRHPAEQALPQPPVGTTSRGPEMGAPSEPVTAGSRPEQAPSTLPGASDIMREAPGAPSRPDQERRAELKRLIAEANGIKAQLRREENAQRREQLKEEFLRLKASFERLQGGD